jgi:hypothetical protein
MDKQQLPYRSNDALLSQNSFQDAVLIAMPRSLYTSNVIDIFANHFVFLCTNTGFGCSLVIQLIINNGCVSNKWIQE